MSCLSGQNIRHPMISELFETHVNLGLYDSELFGLLLAFETPSRMFRRAFNTNIIVIWTLWFHPSKLGDWNHGIHTSNACTAEFILIHITLDWTSSTAPALSSRAP